MKIDYWIFISILACCLSGCSEKEEDLQFTIDSGAPKETMRVITYNILEGMAADRPNNYDNFVEWVKHYDPDVLALQETNNISQAALEDLAQRYGHAYALKLTPKYFLIPSDEVVDPYRPGQRVNDTYTPAITSKYPMEIREVFSTDTIHHGGIFVNIRGVNMVCLHLSPNSTWKTKEAAEDFRVKEINVYLDNTIKKYPGETDWLMVGDFNSVSPVDSAYYNMSYGWNYPTWRFQVHRLTTDAGYVDAVYQLHPYFQATNDLSGETPLRIDYIYVSKAVSRKLTRSRVLLDDFTKKYSDHCPVMVEFRN